MMNFYTVLCLFLVNSIVLASKPTGIRRNHITRTREIIIPVKVHLDFHLSKKIAKEHGFRTRKKIKDIVHNILREANKLFRRPSLNQTITLRLLDTKFLRRTKMVAIDENATIYLKNYCEMQSYYKSLKKKQYYSILLTGLNLFYISNGRKVTKSTARSYTKGVCNVKKSCALLEWKPKNMGYLLAHEIGHSLGMSHDGPPYNDCTNQDIMQPKYDPSNHPNTWSHCSRLYFEYFMRSEKAWCLQGASSRSTIKYNI
ncbi:snake venom metalloproteinase atroxase-like [Pieris napi]|uniref:snake venom metalloproteinase atroxase-like n=1 Tax=Pieris napi TaxID=78633 RepID=UPI001FBAF77A|nr:snake venom metalloproteinase atroxase-like [Pieris napi]